MGRPNQIRTGQVMVKTSRITHLDESKQVGLLVLTITHPILVRFRCSWACSHGFKPAFDGSKPTAGQVVVNKECRFAAQQVSASKTPGSGSGNEEMGAGQEQLYKVSTGNKHKGNVIDAHLSWHLGCAQELRWPQ
jgi:hypothetical protein